MVSFCLLNTKKNRGDRDPHKYSINKFHNTNEKNTPIPFLNMHFKHYYGTSKSKPKCSELGNQYQLCLYGRFQQSLVEWYHLSEQPTHGTLETEIMAPEQVYRILIQIPVHIM